MAMKCLSAATKEILETSINNDMENLMGMGMVSSGFCEITDPKEKKEFKEFQEGLEKIFNAMEETLEFVKTIPDCGDIE